MLRISISTAHADAADLLMQGRLVGPWVEELQAAVAGLEVPLNLVRIDLSSVQFVDAQGIALLQQLLSQGVQLIAVSPFVQELLQPRPA